MEAGGDASTSGVNTSAVVIVKHYDADPEDAIRSQDAQHGRGLNIVSDHRSTPSLLLSQVA